MRKFLRRRPADMYLAVLFVAVLCIPLAAEGQEHDPLEQMNTLLQSSSGLSEYRNGQHSIGTQMRFADDTARIVLVDQYRYDHNEADVHRLTTKEFTFRWADLDADTIEVRTDEWYRPDRKNFVVTVYTRGEEDVIDYVSTDHWDIEGEARSDEFQGKVRRMVLGYFPPDQREAADKLAELAKTAISNASE